MYEIFERLLKARGVTTYQVSKATGITTASFTGWKQGKWNFKQEKLQKIADYFGVSLEYLMTGKDEAIEHHSESGETYYFDDEAAEMAQFLFENPEYKILFDASRKVKPTDIAFVKEMIDRTRRNDE